MRCAALLCCACCRCCCAAPAGNLYRKSLPPWRNLLHLSGSQLFIPHGTRTIFIPPETLSFTTAATTAPFWWSRGNEPTADTERDEWQYLGEVPVTGAYFNDVPDSTWYAEAINTLAEAGIVTGAGSGNNFYPSRPITRAQFSVLLCRALEIEPIESSDSFTDAADAWYTPYLAALKQRGIAQEATTICFVRSNPSPGRNCVA